MRTVTHYFILDTHEVDDLADKSLRFETVEVDFNEYKRIDKIIVDGNDMTRATAKELMEALITHGGLEKIIAQSFPEELENFDQWAHRRFKSL